MGPLTDVCISPADTPARPSLVFESAVLLAAAAAAAAAAGPAVVQQRPGLPRHESMTPGASPSLAYSLHHHQQAPQGCHKHPHKCADGNCASSQIHLIECSGWRADIKMDGHGDRRGL